MCEERIPYSYHTFLFPFLLKNGMTQEQFCHQLDAPGSRWEKADMIVENGKQLAAVRENRLEEARLDYQTFQYFNPAARKALFEEDGGIVSSYSLKNARGGTYAIEHGGDKAYVLDIDAVGLKVFNTGVAVISFELKYPVPQGGPAQARKDVKVINEFGRRLYPEFLTKDQKGFLLCADSISVKLTDGTSAMTDLRGKAVIDRNSAASENDCLSDPIHLPEIITELTGLSEADIEPAIDDRMFVCCCILDDDYTKSLIRVPSNETDCFTDLQKQEHKWRFMEDWDTGCELYALINIDVSAGSCSCQNRRMLDKYFEEQLYLRWVEWGTIHAVTNHSMLCLTGDPKDVMDSVVNPFLIEYVPMCILGLAQRASLLSYDTQITEAVKKSNLKEKPLAGEMTDNLITLAEQFAVFQGQLLLQEVTPQIQGIELYERIQRMLFIPELEKNIQCQLNNLYQIAEANRAKQDSEKDQKMQGAFTAIAILAIASAWVDSYDFFLHLVTKEDFTVPLWWGVFAVILVVVIGIFLYWYWGKNALEKKRGKRKGESRK